MSTPSNMTNFTENSYNLTGKGNAWCTAPKSIYTNPQANFDYFNKNCGDPYTYYAYWYRRFPDQTKYLNCYNIPFKDPLLDNKYGYVYGNKACTVNQNLHFNVNDHGFKYFDRRINPTSKRVTLTPY